jgi:hypothetical protein
MLVHTITGRALDQETVVRILSKIEDYARETERIKFDRIDYSWDYADDGVLDYKVCFYDESKFKETK